MLLRRQGILDAQDELHVWAAIDNAAFDKQTSPVNNGKVKYLDFRPDSCCFMVVASSSISDGGFS